MNTGPCRRQIGWAIGVAAGLAIPSAGQQAASQPAEAASSWQTQPASREGEPGARGSELADLELLELEVPVVVTAARREQPITQVAHAITVITAEDIRRSGARSVPDALRLAPGVDVAELSYSNAAVSPRGFHGFLARQVLVLVDGRQIFDSFFGGTVWGSWPFQLEDIERIEVIRGPAGVTWGANAVNGVINIITRDPLEQRGLTISGGGGSRGSQREYVGYGFGDKTFRMRISGEYEGSDGFLRGGSFLRSLDDEYQAGRASAYGVYEFSPADRLTFSFGSSVQHAGFPTTPLAGLNPGGNRAQSNYALLRWQRKLERGSELELTGFVNDFHVSPGIRSVDYRYQQYAVQLAHTFEPAAQHRLTWGIDTRLDVFDSSNADPLMTLSDAVRSGTAGVFVEDEWRFAPRWTLDLGAALDYDSYGGFQPSARGALSYQLSDSTSLYAAVSRAHQMPPAALRLARTPFVEGLAQIRSDRDLRAQTLIAYELGLRGEYFQRKLHLAGNLFWHEYWDLTTLRPRLGPPGLIRLDEDNRASASLYGLELEARYALTQRWSLLGHYTYQQLDWESIARVQDKDMISPPRHKFMIGSIFDLTDDLHLSAFLYFVDDVRAPNPSLPPVSRKIDEYFRLDLRAEHEFWNDRASVAVGVRNLLDPHHPEGATLFLNNAEVPRMVYAELRVRVP